MSNFVVVTVERINKSVDRINQVWADLLGFQYAVFGHEPAPEIEQNTAQTLSTCLEDLEAAIDRINTTIGCLNGTNEVVPESKR